MSIRRLSLVPALLGLFSALGGAATARDLEFGFTPVLGQSTMEADFQPLMNYLSLTLGQRVALYVAKDYGDLRIQMEAGTVDIGSYSPFAYVDAAEGGKIRIIAQSLIDGAAAYRGVIIARKDSGIGSLSDLRGKRFAFVDRKSASGYVYPRAMVVERGATPETFFKAISFAGDHNKVIAAVLGRDCDAGAVYDGALRLAKAAGVDTDALAVIAQTELIPHDAITVRTGLDPALVERLLAALVGIERTEAGRRVIAENKKGLTGFVAARDGQFDSVRRMAKAAGL